MSHTPGPWTVSSESLGKADVGAKIIVRSDRGIVAMASTAHEGTINAEANARLIAAAPEMLEALKKIWGGGTPSGEQARIAAEIVEKVDPEWNGDLPLKGGTK